MTRSGWRVRLAISRARSPLISSNNTPSPAAPYCSQRLPSSVLLPIPGEPTTCTAVRSASIGLAKGMRVCWWRPSRMLVMVVEHRAGADAGHFLVDGRDGFHRFLRGIRSGRGDHRLIDQADHLLFGRHHQLFAAPAGGRILGLLVQVVAELHTLLVVVQLDLLGQIELLDSLTGIEGDRLLPTDLGVAGQDVALAALNLELQLSHHGAGDGATQVASGGANDAIPFPTGELPPNDIERRPNGVFGVGDIDLFMSPVDDALHRLGVLPDTGLPEQQPRFLDDFGQITHIHTTSFRESGARFARRSPRSPSRGRVERP